jgi:hypothetical protein
MFCQRRCNPDFQKLMYRLFENLVVCTPTLYSENDQVSYKIGMTIPETTALPALVIAAEAY